LFDSRKINLEREFKSGACRSVTSVAMWSWPRVPLCYRNCIRVPSFPYATDTGRIGSATSGIADHLISKYNAFKPSIIIHSTAYLSVLIREKIHDAVTLLRGALITAREIDRTREGRGAPFAVSIAFLLSL
jgi:hypothetical protein